MKKTNTMVEQESWQLLFPTSLGAFSIEITTTGVSGLHFPATRGGRIRSHASNMPPMIRRWHELTRKALQAVLQGNRPAMLPPIDWSGATPFQCKVWKALLRIPPGRTISYGDLARRIGSPRAARAVGAACGANPIPLLVPCHRVLAANGDLGGFSAGLLWKKKLLAVEGVRARTAA